MVAGSYRRYEFVRNRDDSDDGSCYEYERKDGSQCCPQCKARFRRHNGSPRVEVDEKEDDVNDIENEFDYTQGNNKARLPHRAEEFSSSSRHEESLPVSLLTHGHPVSGEIPTPDRNATLSPCIDPQLPVPVRILDPSKDLNSYGLVNVDWKKRIQGWKLKQDKNMIHMTGKYHEGKGGEFEGTGSNGDELQTVDDDRLPMSRVVHFPSARMTPYRIVIVLRLIILGVFLHYRTTHPVKDAYALWLTSVICEIWFAFSWLLDQFPKWYPINRETFLDRLALREYEEFKVRINILVAKAQKIPEDGWRMEDGTPWPGNNPRDHPGMIQVFLGHSGGLDTDGNELPRLIYVSREKRPGFQHHKKAGAMNALIRVSAVLTNGAYLLNVDCDHYFNNSKAIKEAMCFMMDPAIGKKCCYVQFPQRFDGIDLHDRYANRNTVFFDINLKGLDGIQGPVYVGTGCCFNRQALYGYDPVLTEEDLEPNIIVKSCFGSRKKGKSRKIPNYEDNRSIKRSDSNVPLFNMEDIDEDVEGYEDEMSLLVSQKRLEKRFGQSPVFIAATFMEQGGLPSTTNPLTLLKEAIHVISCGYEAKTDWGKEIGWIYGSVTEDILTGFKMHARGWISIYCVPSRPAFKGSAPINLSDRLNQVLRWALGSIEILLSRHCPIWYGYNGRLKLLERIAYINTIVYPITSIPLLAYCMLPAFCLITNTFIIPEISNLASLCFMLLFASIYASAILELKWSDVALEDWWRNEQFWVIGGTSAHLFAVFQGLLKVFAGIDTNFTVTSKASDEDGDFAELYVFKWTSLLIPPTTILLVNLVGIVAGVSYAINSGYQSWGPLMGKLLFAFWVVAHLYPFLKGLLGRQNRTPTIVIVWSALLASIFSLLWVRINPFVSTTGVMSNSFMGE
ncbi:unnamed protein product [Arabidopsis thaliana]|uniref:Cellulose synthase n=1 Tax=Arabidopsis thaliana TaxID=3702 RepID=A0A7G2ED86_ARATH|nr:unnamed protein product [Arabidopsis thaliana]